MSSKQDRAKKNRAPLTLRKERLRNLIVQDLSRVHGAGLGGWLDDLTIAAGICRQSQCPFL